MCLDWPDSCPERCINRVFPEICSQNPECWDNLGTRKPSIHAVSQVSQLSQAKTREGEEGAAREVRAAGAMVHLWAAADRLRRSFPGSNSQGAGVGGGQKVQAPPAGNRPSSQIFVRASFREGGYPFLFGAIGYACAPTFRISAPKCAPVCPRIGAHLRGRTCTARRLFSEGKRKRPEALGSLRP